MYRELVNVANGTKGQLEAIISALDMHEDAPQEIEDLTNTLETALAQAEAIVQKGEAEPEETAAPADEEPTAAASTDTKPGDTIFDTSDGEDPRAEA